VIINADCRTVSDIVAHVMITDPPYSEHVHKNATSNSPGRGVRHNDLGFASLDVDLRTYIACASAKVARWSVIYSDIEALADWRVACTVAGATYIRAVPWVRWSSPQLSGDRPPQGCEMLSLFWGTQRGRKSWNGPGNLTHLAHKCLRGEGKHKTEKPLDQALDLVSWFSNPGETVFDPCAGSGTIGLACKMLGREYIGYEIDADWAAKATERIARDTLSERDAERYARWQESQELAQADAARRAENTERVRAKL
jgi:site-specific DNA-methyltransferase (adenine-specific)